MRGPNIADLEKADAQYKVPLSNALGKQEYKLLDPNSFLHGADIKVKKNSFINDEEGSNKPGVHAAPTNLPSNPGENATLVEVFDDYFVHWRWNGATWTLLTTENRYVTYQLSYSAQGTAVSYSSAVIHTIHDGWKCVRVCAHNSSAGPIAAASIILKNLVAFGPSVAAAANAGNCADFVATTVAAGDYLQVNSAVMPAAPVVFTVTITLQKP